MMVDIKVTPETWIVLLTDNLNLTLGKKFLGGAASEEQAKQLAKEVVPAYLLEYSIAEIDGRWCIQGREPDSDTMSFIGIYRITVEG